MTISIPPFSNVPAPGDPLQSAWAQQLTNFVVLLPRGAVARAAAPIADQAFTGAVDITGLTATWAADPARIYRTTIRLTFTNGASAATIVPAINEGATVLRRGQNTVAGGASLTVTLELIETGLSGSKTRKGTIFSGTAATVLNTSAHVASITVEDLGKV